MFQNTTSATLVLLLSLMMFFGCSKKEQWKYDKTLSLEEQVNPLGITYTDGSIWVSDPDRKRVLQINKEGNILKEFPSLARPMHIMASGDNVYVPIYLEDHIAVIGKDSIQTMTPDTLPDAPAGVWVKGDTIAVADFYNHRIILQNADKTTIIGGEGHEKGQLYYPTDVELTDDKIYVADAYNNRVQVFDYDGNMLQVVGADDGINVATGLTVYDGHIFVTDYFNNKILVYDSNGNKTQMLEVYLSKPTDINVIDDELYIPNYGASSIAKYKRK